MDILNILGWVAYVVALIGLVLNAKGKILCWPIWIVSAIIWVVYFVMKNDTQSIILWVTYLSFNFYGWYMWKKKTKISK